MDESKNKVFCSADYCRAVAAENTELRRFLKMAVDDMNDGNCTRCRTCTHREPNGECNHTSLRYKWRYTDLVESEFDINGTDSLAELCEQMNDLITMRDPERAHGEADDILCRALKILGLGELVTLYDRVEKWYS